MTRSIEPDTVETHGRPSQIFIEADRIDGHLMDWLSRRVGQQGRLSYAPGERIREPHFRDGMVPWAGPPTVTWSVGDRKGPLSVLSFIAAWNMQIEGIGDHPLALEVLPGEAIALPWIWWHPSGCHQAIRFDIDSQTFKRRIVYPTGK